MGQVLSTEGATPHKVTIPGQGTLTGYTLARAERTMQPLTDSLRFLTLNLSQRRPGSKSQSHWEMTTITQGTTKSLG